VGGLGAASLSAPGAGGGGGGGFFGGGGGGSSVPAGNLTAAPVKVISGGGGGGSGFVAGTGPGVRLSRANVGPGSVSGPGEISISWTPGAGAVQHGKPAATAPAKDVADRRISRGRRARRPAR
jgi:hypothetical protein